MFYCPLTREYTDHRYWTSKKPTAKFTSSINKLSIVFSLVYLISLVSFIQYPCIAANRSEAVGRAAHAFAASVETLGFGLNK